MSSAGHDPGSDGRALAWSRATLIFLAACLVYLPVLRAGFIWDDDVSLTANPAMQSGAGLRDLWWSTRPHDYFPLTYTSFWLEWRLWGMNATGYHVTNVLLHALGAVLFWRVLLRLQIPGAWLAALVFAVHPVCVASVAWISERKNTLSLVFFLLSLLWYLRSDEMSGTKCHGSGDMTRRSSHLARDYWLSLVAFLLALLSKTSVVTLPLVLWLCVWWRRSQAGNPLAHPLTHSPTHPLTRLRADLRRLSPFFALALVFGLITVWFQSHRAMGGTLYQRDPLDVRLLGGTWAIWFYLGKALWPANLSMIYPRWNVNVGSLLSYVPALLGVGAALACWQFRRTWARPLLFGLGVFVVLLLPVLGLFDMSFFVYSRVADHLQYLALLGVIPLVVGVTVAQNGKWESGWAGRWEQASSRSSPTHPPTGSPTHRRAGNFKVITAIALVALLAGLTWQRARVFTTPESLWRDTLAKNPRAWVAHNNLANVLADPAEKAEAYRAALRLKPDYLDAHNNLGGLLLEQGRIADALAHFNRALDLDPHSAAAHYNLANVHFDQGRLTDAVAHYDAALRLRPGFYEAQHNSGMALAALGQWDEAMSEFRAVLKLKPDFAPARYQLAEALLKQGEKAEAARWFAAALEVRPDTPEAHYRLGRLLAEDGNPAALRHLREALRLKPDWPEALRHIAWMLATHPDAWLRNGAEAVRLAERAARLDGGGDAATLDSLAAAYAEAGQFADAIATARRALELAERAAPPKLAGQRAEVAREIALAEQIRRRLAGYATGKPYRE